MGEGGRGGRSKKGRIDRNSNARRGCSHRSNSVRGIGCEEHEKTWTWCGILINSRGRGGEGPVLSSHSRIGGSYRKKKVVKG